MCIMPITAAVMNADSDGIKSASLNARLIAIPMVQSLLPGLPVLHNIDFNSHIEEPENLGP